MKKNKFIGTFSGVGLLSFCSALHSVYAAQPDLAVTLAAPTEGKRGPSDTIRLQIPKLTDAVIQRLALELDDMDISAMVSIEGKDILFTPPQPLPWGAHQLRLIETMSDGNIREVGVWSIEIRKSALFREAGLQSTVNLSVSDSLANTSLTEPKPKSTQASGGATFSGMLADGNWRLTGQTDLITNSQRNLLPLGENGPYVDIGTFLLTMNMGPVVAQAGHHGPAPNSLILSGFSRRGVSVGVKSVENNMALTMFGLRSQDVTGSIKGLGVGDADNLISGITLSAQPIGNQAAALTMMATYISGNDPGVTGVGTGVASTNRGVTHGSAGDIQIDSQFQEKRVRVFGEYASTEYDYDGKGADTNLDGVIDSNLEPIKDNAHTVLVTYTPWREKIIDNSPITWNMGMQKNKVGTFFKSIAVPSGAADYSNYTAFTDVNWAGINAQVSLSTGVDNVNDLTLLPRTRTSQRSASLFYNPQSTQQPQPDGKLADIPWYGNPTYNIYYTGIGKEIEQAGGNVLVGALSDSSTVIVAAKFQYSKWDWGITLTTNDNKDQTHTSGSNKSNSIDLSASVTFENKLSLAPKWTYTLNEVSDVPAGSTVTDTATTTAGMAVRYPITEKLSSSLTYTLNRKDTPCGCLDSRTTDVIGNLSWTAIPMTEAKYSVNFSLDGSYHSGDDRSFATNPPSSYQIFLRMSMAWAPQL